MSPLARHPAREQSVGREGTAPGGFHIGHAPLEGGKVIRVIDARVGGRRWGDHRGDDRASGDPAADKLALEKIESVSDLYHARKSMESIYCVLCARQIGRKERAKALDLGVE